MPKERTWEPDHRFTAKEYEKYERLPRWTLDRPDWVGDSGRREYQNYWSSTIISWVAQAKADQSKWKSVCQKAIKEVEYIEDGQSTLFSIDRSLAFQPIQFAYSQVHEQAALICTNPPEGMVVATEESENQYVSAMNHLIDAERKSNNFDQTLYDTVYSGGYYNVGWWKTGVDFDEYGTFGQKGKISIHQIDPHDIHVDPRAKRLDWDYMAYIIQETEKEIGEIRNEYPVTGFDVPDTTESSMYTTMEEQKAEDTIISPIPKLAKGPSWKRQKIKVYEAWFKDMRLKFRAQREDREYIDEQGKKQTEVGALKLDDDGYVMGDWIPAYPKGRCIVVCESVVLEDMPNRLPHGHCPFIPVKQAPSISLFIPGDATRILTVALRMNDLLSRGHAYAQSETERPMHAEEGVFANSQHWKKVPNKSDKMLVLRQGRVLMRPPPVPLPDFFFPFLNQYQQYMDLISGSSAVMRGTISDGAQISAEALSALQNFASSRLALKAKYLAGAVKELTFQLMWLIRRTYEEKITVQVTMPDGTSSTIDWESDRAIFEAGDEEDIAKLISQESYIVDIKSGTGTPNAASAQQGIADKLMDRGCLTKEGYLDAYQYPNRQVIAKQLDEQQKQDVAAEALGRTVGLNVRKLEQEQSKAGRKAKEGG